MEVDFDSLDRIVNLVSRPTPTLTVKHMVKLTRQNPKDKNSKLSYAFKFDTSPRNRYIQPIRGLYFQCYALIQLVGSTIETDKDGTTKKRDVRCEIEPSNFMPFLSALDKAYSWLAGSLYSSTFLLDETGRPLKIKDPFQKEICPLSQTSHLILRPSIIRDSSNLRYEGILMMTREGELTNFTAVEFASFRDQMHSLLPNLYTATSVLVNQAMMYSIYTKLKNDKN